jgi:ribosomal protein L4
MQEKEINFVDEFKVDPKKPLTKQASQIVKDFGEPKKITLVTSTVKENLVKSFSNLENARVIFVEELNAYDILNSGKLLVEKNAGEFIKMKWNKVIKK